MSKRNGSPRAQIKNVDTAVLPSLPQGWDWATLSDLAALEPHSITDGPFGSNLKTSHYTDSGPRVVRLQNIGDGVFIDEHAHISKSHFDLLKRHEIKGGDVVIAALGERLPRSCVVPSWVGPAIVKADCPRFRPNIEIASAKYVSFGLNSPETRRRTSSIIHGVGRPRLNLSEIRGVWLPIAPLNEQRRIVAKIEELFSDLDAGVAALERVKVNLKRYRAAVLKAAVEGKLTEEWRAEHPGAEPASRLLERILTERRQKWEADQIARFTAIDKEPPKNWRARYVEPSPPDTTNLQELPESWCWASVDQLSFVVRGASPRPAGDPRYFGGSVPWITVGSLTADEHPYLRTVAEGLTEAGKEASRWIEPETLLLTNSGATLGVPKITMLGGCINDGSVALLYVDYPLKLYLYYCLKSQTEHLRAINQGAAQPNLNTGIVKSIVIPLSPMNEQEEIVACLGQRVSQVEAATVAIEHSLLRAARLRQSILKQAFKGNLVPQDPNDEPASVLLERLRASRLAHQVNGKATTSARTRAHRAKSNQMKGHAEE